MLRLARDYECTTGTVRGKLFVRVSLAGIEPVGFRPSRSPRYHHTPMTEPTASVVQDTEAPSPLAASHQNHRPQLSQALRRLYGTAQHL